jgi:coenzyme F420-0:L-glutamate ligase / coenzyme F420-1:gamma-L-glutamate ligase
VTQANIPPVPLRLIPLDGLPEVEPGTDLGALIRDAAREQGVSLVDRIVVICQKIVSKAEGRLVPLSDVSPGKEAKEIAAAHDRDPRQVQIVLDESVRIVRRGNGVLITETRHGFVCANAGVDLSNAPGEDIAVLLPEDPDASARRLYESLTTTEGPTPVVITDTFGRPWRDGLVDVALGSAGLAPIKDDRGSRDRAGRELLVTQPATADQLAAAAGLLMLKSAGIPVVIVEGFPIEGDGGVKQILRDSATDLFR